MKDCEIISAILNTFCLINNRIDYELSCIYSDGRSNNIFYISFRLSGKTIGKVSFSGDNGKVCRYYYKNCKFKSDIDIIDLLLDIYNHEAILEI